MAVVSLGLAIGATASAFRIVDAVLLRPLPVGDPDRLSFLQLSYVDSQGQPDTREDFDYPTYRAYARILEGSADVTVVGMSNPIEAGIGPDRDNERVLRQFVSGNFFGTLGLQPSLGRLIATDRRHSPGRAPGDGPQLRLLGPALSPRPAHRRLRQITSATSRTT